MNSKLSIGKNIMRNTTSFYQNKNLYKEMIKICRQDIGIKFKVQYSKSKYLNRIRIK